ncbi:GNAT family N-acetyltransferase [Granulicella tundricola]|uniref:GCN5-related N-acetyltransferase n=1 Tax=Granulicella tundricola (strain ATCC BAA-1859 / DSM 23138 / MP5ACTX9) TaxID=1198114 RepID=E8X1P2_GRATM|nr:GNAT family N-acetyltransferase [Granulicella tundricola]ADW67961.1 GCN5-related N-acetyltransferase [Granulicella tundricola MP5ACTX9]
MSELPIRVCHPGDEHFLSIVASGTFLENFAGTLDGADVLAHLQKNNSVAKYATWLADPQTHIAVSELLNSPIGYAVLCPPDLPVPLTPTDIELRRIYLFQRFQGTGVGLALLNWSIQKSRDLNMTRLLLGVYGENRKAIAWYHRQGFQTIGTRQFLVGTTLHDDLVLALPL